MTIPTGHQAVMPYLTLNNAAAFIDFVKNSFHGEQTFIEMREDGKKIRHAEIQISGSTIMCGDGTDEWKQQNANLFLYVDDADETYHRALQNGATSVTELSDQEYGRTCGVKDPCGNIWWVTSVR